MTKKMRGFTKDGWVRVQRTVLRRVVGDRLQALLRGDFYVRNHLGEEDYDPMLREVASLRAPPSSSPRSPHHPGNGRSQTTNGAPSSSSSSRPSHPPPPNQQKFSPELECFIQLIAASIMIDASMRGENAGESDTRFIKKKKKLLAKTLQGPKLGDFRREVLRFDALRRGEEVQEEEIVESEESRSSDSESESESEEEEFDGNGNDNDNSGSGRGKKRKAEPPRKQQQRETPPPQLAASAPVVASRPPPPRKESGGESSSDESEDRDSTVSDTGTSNTSLSQDGFSASATSSKNKRRKEKKRLKKERKRERKRLKKERRRREREERRQTRRKRKAEERERERARSKERGRAGKRRKRHHGSDGGGEAGADGGSPDSAADGGRGPEEPPAGGLPGGRRRSGSAGEAPAACETATRADFERYKEDLLSRVPNEVKSRFREGGFSRWGKDWLPILELGPFDVEPGPVRDMWLEMLDNTQENGRDMTRLVFWYGVKFEDRGQAYSFVPETKLIKYEEGERKGYCKMPKKIQKKVEKKQRLTKTEEQIKRGLREIEADMQLDKSDRAAWMMQFKEDYELIEEEAAMEEAETKVRSASVGEEKDDEQPQEVTIPKKRKPGRPKKEESAAIAAMDKPLKRKPGRPKKVVDAPLPLEEDDVVKVKKKGPGRPRKSEKEKAEKAAAKAAAKAEKAAAREAAKEAAKAAAKAKKSAAKKWVTVDEDHESEMETDDDENDRDYDFDVDSGDDGDIDVDADEIDSDAEKPKKHKTDDSSDKKSKKKPKPAMSEEEKNNGRRARAAEYREKKAREKAEAQGLEYVKGRVGRKSKQTIIEEEQQKFTKCEEVFLPMMDRLTEAKDSSDADGALKLINSIMDRVELLTPPFLREYPLGMLMKTVRKSFEGVAPEVKERSKRLTAEMKRVYTEKEKKVPENFEPIKNMKSTPRHEIQEDDEEEFDCPALDSVKSEDVAVKSEKISLKSEKISLKSEKIAIKTDKVAVQAEQVEISVEQSISKRNASEISLSEAVPRKMAAASSSECLPNKVKPEPPPPPPPKQKKTFSIKGMFEKPKPAPRPKITMHTANMVMSGQPSPKQKSLPSWVTGPAVKMVGFHEQHAKERTFGLEFLVDAASSVPSSSGKKFDPVSVSQSFELAIFAETKLRGRDWQQYWEKVHDVVAMLSPGKNKRNAILQGIISGDYQEPSELVKLSRREIQSLNQLKI